MQGVPAYCQGCGYIFETQGLILKNVRNATFTNSGTRCPRCGAPASIADGTYTAKDRTISLVDGPPLTRAIVEQLTKIVEKAKVEQPDVHDFLAEVAEVSPEFSQALRKYDRYGLHILILLMLFVLKSCDFSVKVDLNQLVDQGWHMAQGEDPNFHELPKPAPLVPPAPDDARLFLTSGYQPPVQANRRQRRQAQAQSRKRAKRP